MFFSSGSGRWTSPLPSLHSYHLLSQGALAHSSLKMCAQHLLLPAALDLSIYQALPSHTQCFSNSLFSPWGWAFPFGLITLLLGLILPPPTRPVLQSKPLLQMSARSAPPPSGRHHRFPHPASFSLGLWSRFPTTLTATEAPPTSLMIELTSQSASGSHIPHPLAPLPPLYAT